jgi:hypothetical protein
MHKFSLADFLGVPKTNRLTVLREAEKTLANVSRQANAKPAKAQNQAETAISFLHLQPAPDMGAVDTTATRAQADSNARAIMAAAQKARTPTNRKPPAANSVAGQIIAAGKKRRGEI